MKIIITVLLLFTTSLAFTFNNEKAFDIMLNMINTEREKVGEYPLMFSWELSYAAQYHDNEMAKYGYYNHKSEVNGDRVGDRVKGLCGTLFLYNEHYGENMCLTPCNSKLTEKEFAVLSMDALIGSELHYDNMIDSDWNAVGMGFAIGKDPHGVKKYGYYTTHVFAHIEGIIVDVDIEKVEGSYYVVVCVESVDAYTPNKITIIDPYGYVHDGGIAGSDNGIWVFVFPYVGGGTYIAKMGKTKAIMNIK